MSKILITGGNGFIGRNLKEYFTPLHEVFAPSHRELDLLESEEVRMYLKKHSFDVIIHCATHNATVTSTKDRSKVFENNLKMFFNLSESRDSYGKMIYFGSGAEFSREFWKPQMKEEYLGEHIPTDQYGFSKFIIARYIRELEANIYNLRLFGVYGKYEDYRIRFISNTIWNVLNGRPLSINQNVFFDYLYIDDLCRIVSSFLDHKPKYREYNVCTGKAVDLYSIAEIIKAKMETDLPIVVKDAGLKNEYSGDNNRLLQEFGDFEFTEIGETIHTLSDWLVKEMSRGIDAE